MNSFSEYIKEHGKEHPEVGEPAIVFAKHASKNFKAANMNVLKCSLDCVRAAMDACGAGKRVCDDVILCFVPKVVAMECFHLDPRPQTGIGYK